MVNPNQFHESPEEVDRMNRRRAIRMKLQTEFNRVAYNPYRMSNHIEILDPAVSRYTSMRASIREYWKPDWKGFWKYSILTWSPIFILAWHTHNLFAAREEICASGEVPYEKRDFRRI